jgi:hypothetical protein
MKRIILFAVVFYISLLFSFQLLAQYKGDGVNNLGFENWTTNDILGDQVEGWVVINGQKDDVDMLEGNYSLYLETQTFAFLGLQPGMATIGKFQNLSVAPGEPYTQVPTYVEGNIKYNLLENDTALFSVILTNNNITIASADTMFTGVQETWNHFSLMIQWETWGTPDSIQIAITSGGNSELIGFEIGTLTAGSWLKADDFRLTNEVYIEESINSENKILMYPNPCKDILHIKNAENYSVSIYNLLGQKILTEKLSNTKLLNIGKLEPGNYIIEFTKNNFTEVKKLNIIR